VVQGELTFSKYTVLKKGRTVDMRDLPRVTICGCGNGAMAMAADLSLLGCKVNLYEFYDFRENLDPIRKNGGIFLTGNTHSGKTGMAKFNKITDNAEEAIEKTELIMINVPAMAVPLFVEAISTHLAQGQTILVNTGYWASFRSKAILEKAGVLGSITLAEENIMPYLSKKIEPASVHIYNTKKDIRMSAWPATNNEEAYRVVRKVYPQMNLTKNVLENNFFPGNPSFHAQINIPKAEFFFERAKEFRFYNEVSMCASKLMDAFDKEKREVAAAFECDVPILLDYSKMAYGYTAESHYEIYANQKLAHVMRWSTDAANRRVLQEDISYFFVPMEQLAEIVGVPVPVTKAMIEILQVFTDFDYRAKGLGLKDLGMEGLHRDQIIEFVTYGAVS
jgi:opine dehydrogenase